jgi:outer membrane immunogenic protein
MKTFLLATTLLFGLSGHSLAADAIVQEDVIVEAPAAFNWTGAYIGAQAGYLWGDGDFESDAGDADIEPDGWLGGVYVGYNYQMTNNVVVGLDADFAWTGADDSAPAILPAPAGQVGTLDTELEWEGAVRARLGYAVDRFLPYIAGGVAFGRLKGAAYNIDGEYQGEDADTGVGWTIGGGLEYAFTDNVLFRAEYRYTDFGDFEGTVQGFDSTTDFTTNDVRFGVAYKF